MFTVAALDNPVFDDNVYRDSPLQKDPLWQLPAPFIWIALEIAIVAGTAPIVFAAYRAIRDRFASGKSAVELGWIIMLPGSALVLVCLGYLSPSVRERGSGVRTHLEPPFAPPIRKMPPILPVSSVDATGIAITEVKKREGWVGEEHDRVQRVGDTWFILIDNPSVLDDYRAVTVDGKDGRILEYVQPKR